MQNVSSAWKAEQEKNFVGESFVEVKMKIGDPDAEADAGASDNGHEDFSNTAETVMEVEKSPVKYATLETNIWTLDGTCRILPDAAPYGENGYIGSALCDDEGYFTDAIPTITINFSQVFTGLIPGITITWGEAYGEWADSFRVTAYNGTEVVAQESVTGNTDITSVISADIQGYDKIVIEVYRWSLPNRRARIKEIVVGILRTYTKEDIFSLTHEMTVNPLSAELPKSEIVFELKNLNGEYNSDNLEGFAKYIMERQSVTARYGYLLDGEIEWIKAGTFFLSEWDMPQNGITATFTARDALEYMGDKYDGGTNGTLYDIATAAFTQAALPKMNDGTDRWMIDDSLQSISPPASPDMGEASIMEVLQYCANAACCVFYQDRGGLLHIEPLAEGTTDYVIGQFVSYSNADITYSKQLKAVNVNDGQYVLNVGTVGETQPVANPLISDAQAPAVAQWVADYLINRRSLSGEFRADPRLDPLDRVTSQSEYSEGATLITEIRYSYNGAFKGGYEGRQGV